MQAQEVSMERAWKETPGQFREALQWCVQAWRWHTWIVCLCGTWGKKTQNLKDSAFLVATSKRARKEKAIQLCSGHNY